MKKGLKDNKIESISDSFSCLLPTTRKDSLSFHSHAFSPPTMKYNCNQTFFFVFLVTTSFATFINCQNNDDNELSYDVRTQGSRTRTLQDRIKETTDVVDYNGDVDIKGLEKYAEFLIQQEFPSDVAGENNLVITRDSFIGSQDDDVRNFNSRQISSWNDNVVVSRFVRILTRIFGGRDAIAEVSPENHMTSSNMRTNTITLGSSINT